MPQGNCLPVAVFVVRIPPIALSPSVHRFLSRYFPPRAKMSLEIEHVDRLKMADTRRYCAPDICNLCHLKIALDAEVFAGKSPPLLIK